MRRLKKMFGLFVFTFLVGSGAAFFGGPAFSEEHPNILLITADTTRQDHLGVYGYKEGTSPNLDAFSKDALVFSNAFTPIPITTPSHISIFSSLYPTGHKIFRNKDTALIKEKMLAEILRGDAYQTAAFTSATPVDKATGLARGFDVYNEAPSSGQYPWSRLTALTTLNIDDREILERRAADTASAAMDWLRNGRDKHKPFFLWTHFYDAHKPYDPPERYVKGFSGGKAKWDDLDDLLWKEDGYAELSAKDRKLALALYDGEIRYMDHEIGRILSYLRSNGLYERSIIIFMSDHGEILGEKENYYGHHHSVYEGSIRIPLMMKLPGVAPGKVAFMSCSMDVLPTLLAFLKIKDPDETKREGMNVLPIISGSLKKGPRFIYISAYFTDKRTRGEPVGNRRHSIQGIRANSWKYWRDIKEQVGKPVLYDLRADPGEEKNVIDDFPEKAHKLQLLLAPYESKAAVGQRGVRSTGTPKTAQDFANENERLKRLKSLGYL